jgi:hypothetical protein
MHSRCAWSVCALFLPSLAVAVELRNDGFGPSAPGAGFQGGFSPGEEGASRFFAPCNVSQLQAARVLFGGAALARTINLRVYDDSANTVVVGPPIFANNFVLVGNDNVLTEISLSPFGITVPARFRIGVAFTQAGLPSIARDDDGSINPNVNFIQADVGGTFQWFTSQTFGISGDWIIRAEVQCLENVFANGFEDPPPP